MYLYLYIYCIIKIYLLKNYNKCILLPITIKSSSSLIYIVVISGSAIKTLLLPPYYDSFASISPKLLVTDNLPGSILQGPKK